MEMIQLRKQEIEIGQYEQLIIQEKKTYSFITCVRLESRETYINKNY